MIPAVYALFAGLWIALSDMVVGWWASSAEAQTSWSMLKGFFFVGVTAGLLYLGVKGALARERRALRRAEEGEARLRAITDAIPDPVFLKDRESRWLFANAAAFQVVGKPAGAILGRNDLEIYADPAIGRELMAFDRRVMDSGRAEVVEEEIEVPHGRRIFLSSKAPYRDAEGRVVGVIGSARDVTERVRAQEELRRSEQRFRALIEKSTDMLLVLDEQARHRLWNPSVTEALGWQAGQLEGRELLELVHDGDRERVAGVLAGLLGRAGATQRFEVRLRHADGSHRRLEALARNLLQDPAVGAMVVNCRDVTEQRVLEEQFWQSQRLESVGRLAGGVAHDFNNLLTVILAGAEELRAGAGASGPEALGLADEIASAAARGRDLTRHLLAFARRQASAPVSLDPGEVVTRAEGMLHRLLGEEVRLHTAVAGDRWRVRCDPGQLEQVILNLAVNARDAMPGGGTIDLELANVSVAGGEAAAREGVPAGDWVRLVVRDGGVGMPPEVKARLFEPFFTTKAEGRGTGLGLATVYGIVRQAGGHIGVESAPGRGTRFTVHLPRAGGGGPPAAEAGAEAAAGGRETVLLVEDDPQVREVAARTLRGAGYRVLLAGGGEEALALAAREGHRLDLLLTDVVMPGMRGPALAQALRPLVPGMRVLCVSGYVPDGGAAPGFELLPKPFTSAGLLARVRAVLDGPPPA